MPRLIVAATCLLAAVAAAACSTGSEARTDAVGASASGGAPLRGAPLRGARLRKLRVTSQPYLSHAPIMIAHAEGFFRDEGLDVEFVSAMRSQETLVALVTGDVDVRPAPMSAGFLSAIAQQAPIRAVADEGYLAKDGCMYFGILLRKGLDTAGSPPIKRMRTGSDGPTRYITERLLARYNIAIKDIETVNLPDVVLAGSLESGAIDAIATSEPTLSRLLPVSNRWRAGQEATPDVQWGVIAFSNRLLTTDRDLGVRFLRAYRRGVAQFRQGKTPRNIQILAESTGNPLQVIRDACWPSFRENSRINWASVEGFQAWARLNGLMEHTVTEAQVWDSSFLVATDTVRSQRF